jgi:hypothetical protein
LLNPLSSPKGAVYRLKPLGSFNTNQLIFKLRVARYSLSKGYVI